MSNTTPCSKCDHYSGQGDIHSAEVYVDLAKYARYVQPRTELDINATASSSLIGSEGDLYRMLWTEIDQLAKRFLRVIKPSADHRTYTLSIHCTDTANSIHLHLTGPGLNRSVDVSFGDTIWTSLLLRRALIKLLNGGFYVNQVA